MSGDQHHTKQPARTPVNDAPETIVMGGNFFGHDSSIFAIRLEKKNVFAIQTERLTRFKHDDLPPIPAIRRFIDYEKVDVRNVAKIIVCQMSLGPRTSTFNVNAYELETHLRRHFCAKYKKDVTDARRRFDRLLILKKVAASLGSIHGLYLLYAKLASKLGLSNTVSGDAFICQHLREHFPNSEIEVRYYDHEYCHAVTTLVTSPFDEALLFSIDGWGEEYFARAFVYKEGKLTNLANAPTRDPIPVADRTILYSVGAIYEYFTEMLGFVPGSDEGKVEALAAYGKPLPALISLVDAVSFENLAINLHPKLGTALAQIPWDRKEDCAATVQKFLEIITERYLKLLVAKSGVANIALAGGVAANVINNLNIMETLAHNIHITPAMADDAAPQGAAYAYLLEGGMSVEDIRSWSAAMPYYATSYSQEEVRQALAKFGDAVSIEGPDAKWPERAAILLAEGKIGAIFHGRMEWGPRALGNRSIIADPRRKEFRDKINKEIKRRPVFQPFCPSMLAEERERLFDRAYLNKHMTCAFRMKKEFWDSLPTAIH
jgi:carbamoyltransferase